jgi:hypothetical protein
VWKIKNGRSLTLRSPRARRSQTQNSPVSTDHANLAEATTDATGATQHLPLQMLVRAQSGADLPRPLNDWENRLSLYASAFRITSSTRRSKAPSPMAADAGFHGARRLSAGETVYLKGIVRDTRDGQPRIPAGTRRGSRRSMSRPRNLSRGSPSPRSARSTHNSAPKGTLEPTPRSRSAAKRRATLVAEHSFEVQECVPNIRGQHRDAEGAVGTAAVELPVRASYFMGRSSHKRSSRGRSRPRTKASSRRDLMTSSLRRD